MSKTITNIWKDTNGKHMQCHGGSVIKIDDTYYFYGENKDGIINKKDKNPNNYWHHGVKYYSSKDLIDWKDEGFIMPESSDINNPFYPSNIMDRPHIIFNKKNNEFVMWTKSCFAYDFGQCGFAICKGKTIDSMKYVKFFYPDPFKAGDFDLFIHNDKAYIIFENPHASMILYELNEDYDGLGTKYSEHIKLPYPPYVREAPAFFERNGRLMILTSGTTGYYPNETIAYDITNLHGEWKEIGKPCVNDIDKNSFHLQFSSVFYDEKSDTYLAIGDNWIIDFDSTKYDAVELFKFMYSGGKEGKKYTQEEIECFDKEELFEADYRMLKIEFDDKNNPVIKNIYSYELEEI